MTEPTAAPAASVPPAAYYRPPAPAGNLIREGMAMYRADFWTYFSVMLAAALVALLMQGVAMGIMLMPMPWPALRPAAMAGKILTSLVTTMVSIAAQGAGLGAMSIIATANLVGHKMPAAEAIVRVLPALWKIVLATLLVALCWFAGLIFLIIPGIIIAIGLYLTIPVIVLEGKGPVSGIARSWDLIYRKTPAGWFAGDSNPMRVFIIALFAFAVAIGVMLVVGCPVMCAFMTFAMSTVGRGGQPDPATMAVSQLAMSAVFGIAGAFITPLYMLPRILLYYDIRAQLEGFDITQARGAAAAQVGEGGYGGDHDANAGR